MKFFNFFSCDNVIKLHKLNNMEKKYYFCGVGGNGMSPLARLLATRGNAVYGSDRSYDCGRNLAFFEQLKKEGIKLVPQDGSGLDKSFDRLVVTRAVEDSIPDIKKAKELNIEIQKRPLLMADLCASSRNVAIGGTGGKSTTTGMIGHILSVLGFNPTVIDGAIMLNFNSNIAAGDPNLAVFEADESDGMHDVIAMCPSSVAVLTNISLDHFELDELKDIFGYFVSHAKEGVVLNADCKNSLSLKEFIKTKVVTFGINNEADITPEKVKLELQLLGEHNIANALAAIAACTFLGVEPVKAADALKSFKGIKRRLELVANKNGIKVYDDFASNPAKLSAALKTLKGVGKRLVAIFQPHGFQPTKMMKEGYIETFSNLLDKNDIIIMPEIYYVGGSANIVDGKVIPLPKDISSNDLIVEIKGPEALFFANRAEIPAYLAARLQPDDVVVVLGSRDETLPDFALDIANVIK